MHFDLNWGAVLVAAVANVVLGMIWWSPVLYQKQWIKLMGWAGKTKDEMDKIKKEATKAYVSSAVGSLLTSYVLATILAMSGNASAKGGIIITLWLWAGFTGATSLSDYMYGKKPVKLWWINYGYHLAGMIIMALVLVSWK